MAETLSPDSLNAQVAQRVMKCVVDTQHLDPARVTVNSTFQELEIDSLAGINILFAVEQEFNITVPDDEAQKVRTVRELIEGVQKLASDPPESA